MQRSLHVVVLLLVFGALVSITTTESAGRTRPNEAVNVSSGADGTIFLPLVIKGVTLLPEIDPIILAAGDTRSGCETGSYQTLEILDRYPKNVPILHNGDFTNIGAFSEYTNCYSLTWGKHKEQTRPVPGNHEYLTPEALGYFEYFGAQGQPQGKSYYSFDVGTWHIIALNSEIDVSATSAQVTWLENDLAIHPSLCTLAFWHAPRFSSGGHGNNTVISALWQTLYDANAELVLNGHDHDYERFAPQNPAGMLDDARGIREFVIGTGGVAEQPFGLIRPNSEMRNNDTWGILQLTLHPASYDWEFVPVAGKTFSDSGTAACH